MGLILDSSVVIAAERRGDTVAQLIEKIIAKTDDQEAALSAIGLTELVHRIYRAQAQETRLRRESFIHELIADITVYPYERNGLIGWQTRWRTAKPWRRDSLRGSADRSHSTLARLQSSDHESASFPASSRTIGDPILEANDLLDDCL
ncbi:MAG TPA: hypothetical protein VIH89_15895 [Candidatus Sulfotelmatobacter sp.]